jgi:N-acetylglutamate synthase-like GNAT family acetyltransferase
MTTTRSYPITIATDDGDLQLRRLRETDAEALLAFTNRLSSHDLLFLRRDISQPKVVAAWIEAERAGRITTLLATRGEMVLGCATIIRDPLSWASHVGEMRVIVDPSMRGKGLGQKLTQECFVVAIDMGVEKMTAQMTADQRAAIAVFEGMGFHPEALLLDQVRDRDGKKHDIVILGHDVAAFHARMTAYGLTAAI